jgi:hypothetical protein
MREDLYLFLNIWLSIIGAIMGLIGQGGEWIFKQIKEAGIAIVEYSFKFDYF